MIPAEAPQPGSSKIWATGSRLFGLCYWDQGTDIELMGVKPLGRQPRHSCWDSDWWTGGITAAAVAEARLHKLGY